MSSILESLDAFDSVADGLMALGLRVVSTKTGTGFSFSADLVVEDDLGNSVYLSFTDSISEGKVTSLVGNGQALPRNSIFTIVPWKENGTWMFTDPSRNLEREPFVGPANDLISALVSLDPNLDAPEHGFSLVFSATDFPSSQYTAVITEQESNPGTWYSVQGPNMCEDIWLCPALLEYFKYPPKKLYFSLVSIVGIKNTSDSQVEGKSGE